MTFFWGGLALILVAVAGCNVRPAEKPQDDNSNTTAVTEKTKVSESKMTESKEAGENPVVIMETSMGTITIELDAEKAPKTVANMLAYIDEKFYDGTIYHRVIPDFMIQGGGFTPDMDQKKTHANIENEAANGLENARGSIAMARTPDPHSASSQFFINLKDNDFLNYQSSTREGFGYCVFGKVIDGMDVVDEIAGVKTGNHGPHGDVPVEAVVIKTFRRK